jgi:hypothetical protein
MEISEKIENVSELYKNDGFSMGPSYHLHYRWNC